MALTLALPAPGGRQLPFIDTQKDLAGLLVRDSTGLVRSGVLPSHTGALAAARTDLAVDVAAFQIVLVRNGRSLLAANDGATRVAVGQPPTANKQIKIIGVRQNDPAITGSSTDPEWVVTAGTASDTPDLAAAIAANRATGAEPVIAVEMPSGSYTATTASGVVISTICRYTAAAGGVVPVRTKAEADTLALADGSPIYLLDRKTLLVRSGSTWVPSGGVVPFLEASVPAVSSLPASQWIAVGLNQPSALSDAEWGGAGKAGRMVAKTRGRYRGTVQLVISATGVARARFRKNGNDSLLFGETSSAVNGGVGYPVATFEGVLEVDEYLEPQMLSDLSGNQIYGGRATLTYIGAAP